MIRAYVEDAHAVVLCPDPPPALGLVATRALAEPGDSGCR